jgi:mannose/cellobiose epimerase-like protein (N-acyl-D-glucosamine 2-epimerase family)
MRSWLAASAPARGGFHEAINLDGSRLRGRIVRAASTAGTFLLRGRRLGWTSPWRETALYALDFFAAHFALVDSTVVSVVDLDSRVTDATFDL